MKKNYKNKSHTISKIDTLTEGQNDDAQKDFGLAILRRTFLAEDLIKRVYESNLKYDGTGVDKVEE